MSKLNKMNGKIMMQMTHEQRIPLKRRNINLQEDANRGDDWRDDKNEVGQELPNPRKMVIMYGYLLHIICILSYTRLNSDIFASSAIYGI